MPVLRRAVAVGPSLLLLVLTCCVYLPTLSAGFIWDDDDYVTKNSTLRSVSGLWRIWTELGAVPQYYPVTHTTFWVEYQLWGLWPVGYHLDNVLLHACGAILMWRVLSALQLPGSWLAAAIFAVHPVHVESVAWVTERKNVLSGVFYLSAAWFLTRFFSVELRADGLTTGRPKYAGRCYAAALILFAAGLLAKSVVATLPAACLLVLWWKTNQLKWRWAGLMLPFFVLGAVLGSNTAAMERWRVGAQGPEFQWTFAERCLIAGRAAWFYLGKLAWPSHLSFSYSRWQIDAASPWQWIWPLAVVGTLAVLWFTRSVWGRGPLTALLFFGGTLFPALGFVNVFPMRYSYVADHFQYLASLGPIALAAAALTHSLTPKIPAARDPRKLIALSAVWLSLLGWRAFEQCHAYRDLETLWRHTIAQTPDAWLALGNLGTLLCERGEVEAGVELLERAYQLAPAAAEPRMNLSAAWMKQGRSSEAYDLLIDSIQRFPHFAPLHHHLSMIEEDRGDLESAIASSRRASELDSRRAEIKTNLGRLLSLVGRHEEAAPLLRSAVDARPDLFEARMSLGTVLAQTGNVSAARNEFAEAVRLQPGNAQATANLGRTEILDGDARIGLGHLRRALELDESLNGVRAQLAMTLASHHDPEIRDGATALEEAKRLQNRTSADDPVALDALAAASAELGDFAAAVNFAQLAERACQDLGDPAFASEIAARRQLYEARQPYRQ